MTVSGLLLALVAFFPRGAQVEGWTFDFHPLLYGAAEAKWNDGSPVMNDWEFDFSTRLSARSDIFDVSATGAFRRDSVSHATLRRASAGARWPGSPWIGTGIGLSDIQPFESGLARPVVEWGFMDIDSILSLSVEAGGVLGFSGDISLLGEEGSGDTLVVTGIDAPWLGFGTASWTGYSSACSTGWG